MSHLDWSQPLNLAGQTCSRLPASFELIIRQQPVRSRMCGVGERVDRRPIDPPPIVQLKLIGQTNDETLQNLSPYIFMTAVLVPAGDETDEPPRIDFHSKLTIGRTVSSLYLLRDLDDTEGAFFAFSDISVRVDGYYRLRMCLFEIVESGVHYRRGVLTDPFTVYSAKKFPGMHLSCPLARHFAQQGLKIRIRKESRKRGTGSRRQSRDNDDDDDGDSSSDDRAGSATHDAEESSSPLNTTPPFDDRRFPPELGLYSQSSANSSKTNSAYRRVSNVESSSSGKMLRLIASDTTTSRSNITSYSSSSTQETLERAPIHQDVGAFKINVASLLHPSSPDDPTSIISNNMIHPSTTTPSSLSPFILTNNDALRYPLTHASRRIETQQPHSQQLPATPPYWRLPPLTYDSNFTPTATSGSSTTDNIPSVCQASYEQSHRPEARNTQQQHHHHNHSQHYEASNLLASSSSRRESSSSSSNPSLASLHNIDQNHQHQQQMQHSLQRPSATVTAAGSVVSSNKQSAASSSLEAPPDRPELILRTRPILNAGRHSQEDVVLPSLREQLGGLAPPPDEDENNSG